MKMIVLIDLEWVETSPTFSFPTQLAAVRVDSEWNIVDRFHELCSFKSLLFYTWNHIALGKIGKEQYDKSDTPHEVFRAFDRWLSPDDQCFFWLEQPAAKYYEMHRRYTGWDAARSVEPIRERVAAQLNDGMLNSGNAYALAKARGIEVPETEHHALNDVIAIQRLLRGVCASQEAILHYTRKRNPATDAAGRYQVLSDPSRYSYYNDPERQIVHKAGCAELILGKRYQGFNTLTNPAKQLIPACQCCKKEYRDTWRTIRTRSVNDSSYNYIYLGRSQVFHKRTCHLILRSVRGQIVGAARYETVVSTGRVPCKCCKPRPDDTKQRKYTAPAASGQRIQLDIGVTKDLSRDEVNAYKRYEQSVRDRKALLAKKDLTEQEYADGMILSQPKYAFWAARGYGTFHRRECPKLQGLRELRGFSLYAQATRCGLAACKVCRPSRKNEAKLSIPITNKEHEGEDAGLLKRLCTRFGFAHRYDAPVFMIETPVGKWKFDVTNRPIALQHINLVKTPETQFYHGQPRRFLSLKDTFDYIERHDRTLQEKSGMILAAD